MSKKTKHYLCGDKRDLDKKFYESYDENFLFHKAKTLLLIADAPESFRQFAKDHENYPTVEGEDKIYSQELRAEVHFTEFHQFEAFFALLIALFQPLPHWLFLTTYTTQEFKAKVQQYLDGDINGLTNGMIQDRHEFICQAIYTSFTLPNLATTGDAEEDEKRRDRWKVNTGNIAWLLTRVARKYLEGAEYNGYKHGLRVMAGPVFLRIFANDANGEPESLIHNSAPEDALRYLETKEVSREDAGAPPEVEGSFLQVYEVSKGFNPIESINHLYLTNIMLRTLKTTRLAIIKGDAKDVFLHTLFDLDRDAFAQLKPHDRWSVSL